MARPKKKYSIRKAGPDSWQIYIEGEFISQRSTAVICGLVQNLERYERVSAEISKPQGSAKVETPPDSGVNADNLDLPPDPDPLP